MLMTKQNKRETRNANNNGARAIENLNNNKAREYNCAKLHCWDQHPNEHRADADKKQQAIKNG